MIEVKEVTNKKMQKEFLNFPDLLYKDCPYYVPALVGDEKKIFKPTYYYYENCEAIYFNAYKDGEMVGRISGIIQKQSNEKNNEKRARFTRFDTIDDLEVAKALLSKAEEWAISKGMDTICGPLGFSDLERLGMLVKGFREYATYEEAYNYDYYPKLIEQCGYEKEVDWLEFKLFPPRVMDEKITRLSKAVQKRYKLHVPEVKNVSKFLDKYENQVFEVLDECYKDLYGTVPFTESMIKNLVAQFKLVIKPECLIAVCDENENVVAFGFGMPSLGEAVKKSKGKMLPFGWYRILKAIKNVKVMDLAVIGVKPELQHSGIVAVLMERLMNVMVDEKLEHCETNFCLEHNTKILKTWELFEREQHKTRRAYVKKLVKEEN